MINLKNGDVTLDNNLVVLKRGMDYNSFNSLISNKLNTSVREVNNYRYITVEKSVMHNTSVKIICCFNPQNHLINIQIDLRENYSQVPKTWETWSLDGELFLLRKYNDWLNKHYNLKFNGENLRYQFNWGTLFSYYDSKTGNTSMGINYK